MSPPSTPSCSPAPRPARTRSSRPSAGPSPGARPTKVAHIIIPVYKAPGQDLADAAKGTRFYLLQQVLSALKLYDEHVFHRVHYLRHPKPTDPLHPVARPERADELIPLLSLYAEDPHNCIWELGLESARRYREQHGHLKVPSSYRGPDRFSTSAGGWATSAPCA